MEIAPFCVMAMTLSPWNQRSAGFHSVKLAMTASTR